MANSTQLNYRKMTSDDLPIVSQLEKAAHYHPWSKQLLADALTSYHSWLLLDDEHIIGYGILKVVADEAELLNIVIAASYQGKGLGKKLLTKMVEEGQRLGAKECFLEVRASNRIAYKLYEQFGFNEIARRPNYYPAPQGFEDALVMVFSIF